MRICLVVLSDGWGGAESVVHDLARQLESKGENILLILNSEIAEYFHDLKGVKMLDIGNWYPPTFKIDVLRRFAHRNNLFSRAVNLLLIYLDEIERYRRSFRIVKRLKARLSEDKMDIIHSHRAEADILLYHMRSSGLPILSTIHGEHALTGRVRSHPLGLPLLHFKGELFKRALSRMSAISVVCKSEADALHAWGVSTSKRIEIIHNGIDLQSMKEVIAK